LINNKGQVSQRTVDTINKVSQLGIPTTLCTGRNITKTLPIAKRLNLKVPFVCIDGILLFDPITQKPLNDMSISRSHAEKIIEIGKEYNTFLEVSNGYKYYKHFPTKAHIKYDTFNKHHLMGRISSYLGGIRYVKDPNRLLDIEGTIYQSVIAAPKDIAKEIAQVIRQEALEKVEVRDNLWQEYLFINHEGMGKARGVKLLCDHFKINPKEVIAFGDERNDLDMLEFVGCGVAMDNAQDSVKEIADKTTLSNEFDGVAVELEKLFLSR
ncbi:MAG: HAD family hydrolase, partial [Anaerotignaceae bacterium]